MDNLVYDITKESTQLAFNFTPAERSKTSDIPAVRVRVATTGYIKAAGNVVRNASDVASLGVSIHKAPQEAFHI